MKNVKPHSESAFGRRAEIDHAVIASLSVEYRSLLSPQINAGDFQPCQLAASQPAVITQTKHGAIAYGKEIARVGLACDCVKQTFQGVRLDGSGNAPPWLDGLLDHRDWVFVN